MALIESIIDVILFTRGTKGDIFPFMRLGRALRKQEINVTLVSNYCYEYYAQEEGINFIALDDAASFETLNNIPEYHTNFQSLLDLYKNHIIANLENEVSLLITFVKSGKSAIVAHSNDFLSPLLVREILGVPLHLCMLAPSYVHGFSLFEAVLKSLSTEINAIRDKFGLKNVGNWGAWIKGFDDCFALWPEWFSNEAHNELSLNYLGFLSARSIRQNISEDKFDAFLAGGGKRILLTHGSSRPFNEHYFLVGIEAFNKLDYKIIITTPFRELLPQTLPHNVMWMDFYPFHELFLSIDIIIHHGGIGTTHEAIANAVPQLIIGQGFDRQHNGKIIKRLGLGDWMPPHNLNSNLLNEKINELLSDQTIVDRCKNYREHLYDDDALKFFAHRIITPSGWQHTNNKTSLRKANNSEPGNKSEKKLGSISNAKSELLLKLLKGKINGGTLHKAPLKSIPGGINIAFQQTTERSSMEKQALLQKLLKNRSTALEAGIKTVDRATRMPLSWSQQQIWLICQLSIQAGRSYHVPLVVKLHGNLNVDAFVMAYDALIKRHEILRTNFKTDSAGKPYQYINENINEGIQFVDLTQSNRFATIDHHSLVNDCISKDFNLAQDNLIRGLLIKRNVNEFVFVLVLHHIVTDAWSMGILTKELSLLYAGYSRGNDNPLHGLNIQYVDYACWQRDRYIDDARDLGASYWREELKDLPVLDLPLDHSRPPINTYKGAWLPIIIDTHLVNQLKQLGRQQSCSLFMTLLSVLNILLHKFTRQTDLCVGTPIANRNRNELESLIGYFVNTVALRTKIDANLSFREFLRTVKRVVQNSFQHQSFPFELVVDSVLPDRNLDVSPIFQVMLVLQNVAGSRFDMPGLSVEFEEVESTTSKFDLTLIFEEMPDGALVGGFEYSTDIFERETINRLGQHLIELVKSVIKCSEKKIQELEVIPPDLKHQMLYQWNQTASQYQSDKCIHEIFESLTSQHPDAIAIVFEGGRLTYRELNERANQLAWFLLSERNVLPDSLIGVCIERSPEMIVAILAILKVGAGYLPLDPDYPEHRLRFIINDASLETVITQKNLQVKTNLSLDVSINIDNDGFNDLLSKLPNQNIDRSKISLTSSSTAYVIYTSGTTGNPKGVLIKHSSVNSLVISNNYVPLSSATTLLQFAPISFDAATFEIWGALLNGGKIVQPKTLPFLDLAYLINIVEKNDVNTMWLTSALFDSLVATFDKKLSSLKWLIVGGDVVKSASVEKFLNLNPAVSLINGYGPTESTTFTCCYPILGPNTFIPIGRPIKNRTAYIVDDSLGVVPIGVSGELLIGGAGLAKGYLNRQELNAEKFIQNPFRLSEELGNEFLYRTGDICRYAPCGNIEFLGRLDNQVKIRGFRVELQEVEQTLMHIEFVDSATVLAIDELSGSKKLIAFVACARPVNNFSYKNHLETLLPHYMVPSEIIELASMPLTPNGKVDVSALKLLIGKSSGKVTTMGVVDSAVVSDVVTFFKEIIGAEDICSSDDFFHIGGTSLNALFLIEKIRTHFDVEVSARFIFKHRSALNIGTAIERFFEASR